MDEPSVPVVYAAEPAPLTVPNTDRLAIAALAVGVVSLLGDVLDIGLLLGPVAAILGYVSWRRIANSDGELRGRGLALAGLILGVIAFVIGVLVAIIVAGLHSIGMFM